MCTHIFFKVHKSQIGPFPPFNFTKNTPTRISPPFCFDSANPFFSADDLKTIWREGDNFKTISGLPKGSNSARENSNRVEFAQKESVKKWFPYTRAQWKENFHRCSIGNCSRISSLLVFLTPIFPMHLRQGNNTTEKNEMRCLTFTLCARARAKKDEEKFDGPEIARARPKWWESGSGKLSFFRQHVSCEEKQFSVHPESRTWCAK